MDISKEFRTHDDETADDLMVYMVAVEMRLKLAKKRAEGRGGWHTDECDISFLRRMLETHIGKGDMVDVLNFAGMIMVKELIES